MRRSGVVAWLGVLVLVLSGCSVLFPRTASAPQTPTTTTAGHVPRTWTQEPVAPTRAGSTEPSASADLGVGACGHVDGSLRYVVYLASPATMCDDAFGLLDLLGGAEGVDASLGQRIMDDGWTCPGLGDVERSAFAMALACSNGSKGFFVRPAEVAVPPGFQAFPGDFNGEPGSEGIYFSTPSGKQTCQITGEQIGCDGQNFPDDVPAVDVDGEQMPATALILETEGKARFAYYGDPAFLNLGANGPVPAASLGYGVVLIAYGFTCTSDESAGAVCVRGSHGFAISSHTYDLR